MLARLALLSAGALLLSGCAELPADAPVTAVDYKACIVEENTPLASPLVEVADYGVKQAVVTYGITRYQLSVIATKLKTTVAKQVKQHCNLIVVSGIGFADQLAEVAKAYPGANFVYVSDQTEPALVNANLENLVVYSVDTYEAGLLSGYLAAGLTDNAKVLSGVCPIDGYVEPFRKGATEGVSKFSVDSGTSIENILLFDMFPANGPMQPDVTLSGGCGVTEASSTLTQTESKWVGYGLDLYYEPTLSKVKGRIAVTVVPQLAPKLMELIGSDLEGDFIGGRFGSYHATYGNGGLALSPEHDINVPATLTAPLKTMAEDYEASLKK